MKDLKHFIFFENLLQEANNDLVKQAKREGKLALGYTCYFMPEVLLDLAGCFSVRLRAPRCTSPDIATYYMSSRTCHYGRSLLERALEGGYNFLDAQLATETCTVTCRFQEHLQQKHGGGKGPSPKKAPSLPHQCTNNEQEEWVQSGAGDGREAFRSQKSYSPGPSSRPLIHGCECGRHEAYYTAGGKGF